MFEYKNPQVLSFGYLTRIGVLVSSFEASIFVVAITPASPHGTLIFVVVIDLVSLHRISIFVVTIDLTSLYGTSTAIAPTYTHETSMPVILTPCVS